MRRKKPREVSSLPQNLGFRPINDFEGKPAVILTVDEYETIRLVDKEGFPLQIEGEDYLLKNKEK